MPPKETVCIDLGGWIVAFYAVYALAAIAALSAAGVFAGEILRTIRSWQLERNGRQVKSNRGQITVKLDPPHLTS